MTMSGRVRVTLPDGRRVTGFRKTSRRRLARVDPHLMPDFTVSVVLTRFSVKPGENLGVTGIETPTSSHVTVTGKSRDWCIAKMRCFLKRLGVQRHQATLTRADEPGPSYSGPIRKGYERVIWIETSPAPGRYLEKDEDGIVSMRELPLMYLEQ